MACTNQETKTETTSIPKSSGITVDSSANTDLILKAANCISDGKYDVATYKTFYADSAVIIHDNGKTITIKDNAAFLEDLGKNGIIITIDKKMIIWEDFRNKPDQDGVKSTVFSYQNNTIQKGDKTLKLIVFQANKIKDGKIVEEWLVYDTAPIMEVLK
jgi:hypothetical protein